MLIFHMVRMLLTSYHFAPRKTKMLKIICLNYSVVFMLGKKKSMSYLAALLIKVQQYLIRSLFWP